MKFSPVERSIRNSRREYEIYTYLNAIDDPNIEIYGIPTIYYYGTWNNEYTMMAKTLLDTEFEKKVDARQIPELQFQKFVSFFYYYS